VTYTDQSSDATTWIWSFPGGNPSGAQTQGPHQVEYAQAGSYSAILQVYNQYGQDIITKNDIVTATLCVYEFGDAPEGVIAYPATGVIGQFPTCKTVGPAGYI